MGKGHEVADMYIGIREGSPHPTMAMKVGMGSSRTAAGVMDAVRLRMYSWQFWQPC